jgi:simple sugar transport system substrate-binding protein
MKKIFILLLIFTTLLSCKDRKRNEAAVNKNFSVLVFITGVTAGSPSYELMAEGALEFARDNRNVTVKVYEAGFNQAEWESQLADMVSSGNYDLVLGTNPSLPELCANVAIKFPNQKFIITDAFYQGNPQIKTYLFNQYEQSLYLGYLAGLVSESNMPYANRQKKIGFIAAQEYPLLTKQIIPGFLDGARLVDQAFELDRRIIGSWADANKAAELASSMIDNGVDVFTSIAGGAAAGLYKTVKERGAYAVCFNTNEYKQAPGYIVGCGIMEQKKLVIEILNNAFNGNIQYGIPVETGVKEGYLGFIDDDPAYNNNLPLQIRERFEEFFKGMREGHIKYTVPAL